MSTLIPTSTEVKDVKCTVLDIGRLLADTPVGTLLKTVYMHFNKDLWSKLLGWGHKDEQHH